LGRPWSSTQVIATHFADKQGLLDALFARGFDALTDSLQSVPTDAGVAGCMRAYRAFAKDSPQLYKLMFSRLSTDYAPGAEAREAARRCFDALIAALPDLAPGTAHGARAREAATARATYVWAVSHGHVSLELAELLVTPPSVEEAFERAIRNVEALQNVRPRKPRARRSAH
jgi:AcrR family transcriptional regulator